MNPQSVKLILNSLPARAYCEAITPYLPVEENGIKVENSFICLHICIDYTKLYVVHLWRVAVFVPRSNNDVMDFITCDTETKTLW